MSAIVPASIPLPVGRLVGVGAVIFFANAALLVLQLVAGRFLAPFVGSSLETWTSVIGVFLAGIALGNGFGGWFADRYPTPRTLAVLLAFGAVAALWVLLFPLLVEQRGLHKLLPLEVRIPILAAVLCLPAGFVLSLLTPLAIKLGLPDVTHTGRVAGLIFALSTLGCLVGNYSTGFYLIPTFTINVLVEVSAGVLLALAVLTLVVVRPGAMAEGGAASSGAPVPAQRGPPPPDPLPDQEGVAGGTRGGFPLTDGMGQHARVTSTQKEANTSVQENPRSSVTSGVAGEVSDPSPPLPSVRGAGGVGSTSADQGAEETANTTPNPHAFTDIRYAYLVVFLASFCGMTLELTASRVLAQQLGVSLFTWTGIIGVMLAGTALGNFTGGQLADRPRRTLAGLGGVATVVVLIGVGLAVAFALEYPVSALLGGPRERGETEEELRARLARLRTVLAFIAVVSLMVGIVVYRVLRVLPDLESLTPRTTLGATLCFAAAGTVFLFVSMALITRLEMFTDWEPITQVMGWTFGLFFLPMFALGLVSPQVIRLAVPDVAHAGRVAGRVYAWSTVGAIVGTFVTGYVLLSTLGMHRTILCASLVLLFVSLIVAEVWDNNPLLYLFSIVLGGITGGFILTGVNHDPDYTTIVESNYYTIKVGPSRYDKVPETALNLNLDHLLHSIVDPYDPTYLYYAHEYIQVEFVRLAKTENPEPKVLVIGGGGYTFPRYLMSKIPETHVDVVEIDPKVTQVAYDSLGLEKNPHLNPIHMDGRQFVSERAVPGSYDLVVQDAVNDLSVPAHLMTKEYNDAVKGVLQPNGVYLLTIIDSVAYGKLWKAAMVTLERTFKHVVLLRVPEDRNGPIWYENRTVLVIYASDRPFSAEAVRAAVYDQVRHPDTKTLQAMLVIANHFGLAVPTTLNPLPPTVHTTMVDPGLLKKYTDREPGVFLTDQFCPVDNLMADVYRNRYR